MPNAAPLQRQDLVREIGKLCVGGDWACAHGDLETLGHIAQGLVEYVQEPLHCDLLEIVDLCACDPDRATAAWIRMREIVQGAEHAPP